MATSRLGHIRVGLAAYRLPRTAVVAEPEVKAFIGFAQIVPLPIVGHGYGALQPRRGRATALVSLVARSERWCRSEARALARLTSLVYRWNVAAP